VGEATSRPEVVRAAVHNPHRAAAVHNPQGAAALHNPHGRRPSIAPGEGQDLVRTTLRALVLAASANTS
jgi:hypothetical protein